MKIGGPSGVKGPAGVKRTARARGAAATSSATSAGSARNLQDITEIMGIEPADMTEKVRSAIMALLEEVSTLRHELEAAQRRLSEMEQVVDQDPLIPIPNRRAFVREMSRLISFAERYGTPSSLLYIDLNDIKSINDTYGHAAGDAALLHVAEHLVRNIRDIDVVGRLGGDEFGILLVQSNEDQATLKAEALAKAVAKIPLKWKGEDISLSLAYGVYTFTEAEDPAEALAHADRRMYEHKRAVKAGK